MSTSSALQRKEHHHHAHAGIFSFTMKIGDWKKIFRPAFYKTLIAVSLNYTVHKGEFRHMIVGYLITDRRVCLVLYTEHKKVRRMLDHFYRCLHDEIHRSLEMADAPERDYFLSEITGFENAHGKLFTEYELRDIYLIRLLTGREPNVLYPDARVLRLKERLRNYPFCSVINYNGGESPVLVRVLKKKTWEEIERLNAMKNSH